MIHFQCGNCGKSYNVNDDLAGRTANCQQCGLRIVVPSPSPPEQHPFTDPMSGVKQAKPKKVPVPHRESNKGTIIIIGVGIVAILLVCGIGLWVIANEKKKAEARNVTGSAIEQMQVTELTPQTNVGSRQSAGGTTSVQTPQGSAIVSPGSSNVSSSYGNTVFGGDSKPTPNNPAGTSKLAPNNPGGTPKAAPDKPVVVSRPVPTPVAPVSINPPILPGAVDLKEELKKSGFNEHELYSDSLKDDLLNFIRYGNANLKDREEAFRGRGGMVAPRNEHQFQAVQAEIMAVQKKIAEKTFFYEYPYSAHNMTSYEDQDSFIMGINLRPLIKQRTVNNMGVTFPIPNVAAEVRDSSPSSLIQLIVIGKTDSITKLANNHFNYRARVYFKNLSARGYPSADILRIDIIEVKK